MKPHHAGYGFGLGHSNKSGSNVRNQNGEGHGLFRTAIFYRLLAGSRARDGVKVQFVHISNIKIWNRRKWRLLVQPEASLRPFAAGEDFPRGAY